MENWNNGMLRRQPKSRFAGENWNIEATAEILPIREKIADCRLQLPIASFKDAIPSNKQSRNDKPFFSGLASFQLVAEQYQARKLDFLKELDSELETVIDNS